MKSLYFIFIVLLAEATTLIALQVALKRRGIDHYEQLRIHSDGGGQYYSRSFTRPTRQYGIVNSMGRADYENPAAERLNGILKDEYLPENRYDSLPASLKTGHTLYFILNTQYLLLYFTER